MFSAVLFTSCTSHENLEHFYSGQFVLLLCEKWLRQRKSHIPEVIEVYRDLWLQCYLQGINSNPLHYEVMKKATVFPKSSGSFTDTSSVTGTWNNYMNALKSSTNTVDTAILLIQKGQGLLKELKILDKLIISFFLRYCSFQFIMYLFYTTELSNLGSCVSANALFFKHLRCICSVGAFSVEQGCRKHVTMTYYDGDTSMSLRL